MAFAHYLFKNINLIITESFFGIGAIHKDTNKAVKRCIEAMKEQGAKIVSLNEKIDSDYLVNDVSVHLHDLKNHLNVYLGALQNHAPVHSVEEVLASGKVMLCL